METPHTIMIQTLNTCQLACKNCFLEHGPLPVKEMMPLSIFKDIIDRCPDVGHVHLTPIVGEPTIHPDIYEQLDYLSEKENILKISMFTNFLNVDVKRILKYSKLHLIISVYGSDSKMYLSHTQRNLFHLFFDNMNILYKNNFMNLRAIEFFMRAPLFDYQSTLGKMIQLMVKCRPHRDGVGNFILESFWNGNWCGEMAVENLRKDKKEGICAYAPINNSIDVTGDVILCGACDILKTTKIGNIFSESLEDIYRSGPINRILENQKRNIYEGCCAKCSEFHKRN